MVNFPLERLCQPWNSIFVTAPGSPTVSSSSISVFKFYLRLQSSNSIFDFNLHASFARLSFQVNKTCWKSPKLNTVCGYKNVLCHFFVGTVLGLASEPKLVVVKNPFKCVFWIYWTLVFRKKLDHDLHPSTLNTSYHKGGWRGKCWKNRCFVSQTCGLSISKSLRVRQIILFPTY